MTYANPKHFDDLKKLIGGNFLFRGPSYSWAGKVVDTAERFVVLENVYMIPDLDNIEPTKKDDFLDNYDFVNYQEVVINYFAFNEHFSYITLKDALDKILE